MLAPFALNIYTFMGKIYALTEVAFSVKQYLIMPGSAISLEETLFNNFKRKINIELRYVKFQITCNVLCACQPSHLDK